MRLWLKLAVIVGLSAGVQGAIDRNAAAINEAVLALRCGNQGLNADEDVSAGRARERQDQQFLAAVAATH